MGNAFVPCEVVYCIDSYKISKCTTINFAYDTKTGKWRNPNVQFTNQYGYNSMVANNPEKEYSTPGTTGVWSLIPSCLRKTRLTTVISS